LELFLGAFCAIFFTFTHIYFFKLFLYFFTFVLLCDLFIKSNISVWMFGHVQTRRGERYFARCLTNQSFSLYTGKNVF